MADTELLLLRAEDGEDLRILSACVQDMTVRVADVSWNRKAQRLVLMGNRFRWESVEAGGKPTRVRSALRFDFISRVQQKEWPEVAAAILPLLGVEQQGDGLILLFGGGPALRIESEVIDVTLEDLSGPWAAQGQPDHKLG